ncbi:unnamed protein product [Paramecium sonneborni]|uniref:Uncharacterized protein n=1 Tax=Paramecium sonneborni TaxID=65129 RepID=A0A8S1NC38_9CILI|nr:unnamed protein product [Paramecium sonneborni]
MDNLQQLLQELFCLLDQNFFLSREFKKLFSTYDNLEQIAQEKKYKELAQKLIEFILSIHKINQPSVLEEKIAKTHKLLNNYQSLLIIQQQKEIPQIIQNEKQLSCDISKSNPNTARELQGKVRKTTRNQQIIDKQQLSQQFSNQKKQKGMQNSDSQQKLFIENIPKMGRSLVKDDQQRNYNIITGV